jgi:hypothetical protein
MDPRQNNSVMTTGCMSQGNTIDEALNNIKDAIKGWLHVEEKHGRLEVHEEKEVFLGEVSYWRGCKSKRLARGRFAGNFAYS